MREKVFDKVWEWTSRHPKARLVTLVLFLFLWLRVDKKSWEDLKLYGSKALRDIGSHSLAWVGLGLAIVGYLLWIVLVKVSHKHWLTDVGMIPRRRDFASEGRPCTVSLVEIWSEKRRGWDREVRVQNTSDELLTYVAGRFRISVYEWQGERFVPVRTQEIPFTVRHLEPEVCAVASERVPVADPTANSYDVLLEEVTSPLKSIKDAVQLGNCVFHNYTTGHDLRFLRRTFWPRRQLNSTKWLRYRILELWDLVKCYAFSQSYRFHDNGRRIRTTRERCASALGALGILLLGCLLLSLTVTAAYGTATVLLHFVTAAIRFWDGAVGRIF